MAMEAGQRLGLGRIVWTHLVDKMAMEASYNSSTIHYIIHRCPGRIVWTHLVDKMAMEAGQWLDLLQQFHHTLHYTSLSG